MMMLWLKHNKPFLLNNNQFRSLSNSNKNLVHQIRKSPKDWKKSLSHFDFEYKLSKELGNKIPKSDLTSAYNEIIKFCAKQEDQISIPYNLLSEMKMKYNINPTITSYQHLIIACNQKGNYILALSLLKDMENKHLRPNILCFTSAISACSKLGKWEKSLEIYESMKLYKVNPNPYTYNSLISSFGKTGKWQQAYQIFNDMMKANKRPDRITYNALIHALGKGNNMEKMYQLCDEMQQKGFQPDIYTINSMLNACLKNKQYQNANDIINRYISTSSSLSSSSVDSDAVIDDDDLNESLNKQVNETNDSLHNVEVVKQQVHQDEIPLLTPDDATFTLMMSLSEKTGDSNKGLEIFDIMLSEFNLIPSLYCYNTALILCGKTGQWEKASEIFSSMEAHSVRPDIISFNAAINACANSGESDKAFDIFKLMSKYKVKPDVVSYNSAINACTKNGQWQNALQILNEMKSSSSNQPNIKSYNSVLNACVKAKQLDEALKLIKLMHEDHVLPNLISYNSLIMAYGKKGKWKESLEIYELMLLDDSKVFPDSFTISAVIQSCIKGQQIDKGIEIFEHYLQSHETLLLAHDKSEENTKEKLHVVPPDIFVFNTAMVAYNKSKQFTKVLEIFELLQPTENENDDENDDDEKRKKRLLYSSYQVSPDRTTYNIVLSASVQTKGSDTLKYLKLMKNKHNIDPDIISFGYAFTHCVKTNQPQTAIELFENSFLQPTSSSSASKHKKILSPNLFILNVIIGAFSSTDQFEQSIELFNSMESRYQIQADLNSFNLMICLCANHNKYSYILELLKIMKERKIKPNEMTLELTLKSCFEKIAQKEDNDGSIINQFIIQKQLLEFFPRGMFFNHPKINQNLEKNNEKENGKRKKEDWRSLFSQLNFFYE